MKKTLIFSAVLALMLGACNSSSNKNEQTNSVDSASTSTTLSTAGTDTSQTFTLDTTALASDATFYQCEMDHDVLSDKPGTCPKCGMELMAMKKQ